MPNPVTRNLRTIAGYVDSGRIGKRNRPPTSCEPCRIRKLKCNRASPCDTCIQRDKQSSCEYAANANRNKPAHATVGDRLQNLENIVSQFLQNGVTIKPQDKQTYSSNDATDNTEAPGDKVSTASSGSLHVRDGQMTYVDSNHWLSILDDIKEVREQLSLSDIHIQENPFDDALGPDNEVDLMFSPMPSHNLREILQSLPPRPVCDSLLSQYFNLTYMVIPILHPAKFQKEYEDFWQDSSKSSTIWIGLLFSILSVAAALRQINTTAAHLRETTISADTFRLRTRQCIVLGKYSTARSYGLETLLLHLQSNFIGVVDSNINLWFLMGIIIRLAMRLGYHRDSKGHSSISPFEGEMRRRIWASIYQLDVLTSFQLGLPSMIPSEYCDTEAPRNLNYSDFGPDTAALPPSRSLSDHTPASYTIVKGKVMNVFKKIVGHTQALSPSPLESTMMLDMEMRETYDNIPPSFKMKPISQSFLDTTSTIMNKCNIELLYLKAIVVLHRRYLNTGTTNSDYTTSRRHCLDAALRILSVQEDLHQASQPGGLMYDDRWMISSLAANDFLLAAMVVCLELSEHVRTAKTPRSEDLMIQFEALQTSHMIWASASSYSKDAYTAAQALGLMIQKIKDSNHVNTLPNSPVPGDDMLKDTNFIYAEPMVDMLNSTETLDWTLLDQYFQNHEGHHDISPVVSTADFEGAFD